MLLMRRHDIDTLTQQASAAIERAERLEREHEEMRARIEGLEQRLASEAALRAMAGALSRAAHAAPAIGGALERFALAMRSALSSGRAGGLARAQQAATLEERWPDGRYMSHWDYEQIERQVADRLYMRNAAGGFARNCDEGR
jgi:hypothetical protein